MRVRKVFALMGTITILGGCLLLYAVMDLTLLPHQNSGMTKETQKNRWSDFEGRLHQLEGDIQRNQDTVVEIKEAIDNLLEEARNRPIAVQHLAEQPITEEEKNLTPKIIKPRPSPELDLSCPALVRSTNNTDIQMDALYRSLPFDNADGGVWKQGWSIKYNPEQWSPTKKLKVFVVPHSHNDPGWIKTFEDYYQSQTRSILTNMVQKLSADHRRRFIWAEISFFQLWWSEINSETQERTKALLQNGQLEIVTGGWVMNDEANAHYWSILHQLTEGHEWMQENLGYKPRYGWAIDPFGYSATMPYLLKLSGFQGSIIQRVHYAVKKRLARDKNLEFRWRQAWGGKDWETDLVTHVMPFYSYDVPHTCGPDPKVCCQFDFKRLPGYGVSCPWRIPPQPIKDKNVAERSELLLDQYRKKAQLYRTNALFVPLGDDFRYDHATEWDAQFNNYQAIFDHLNSRTDLNVEARFGTLDDYFAALFEEIKDTEKLPSLSGDFFTYADRDDHYWSGYYTSRPYYKRLDRVLMGYLRAAEILFSLSWGVAKEASPHRHPWLLAPASGLMQRLTQARRAQALFQHHDGVTGTAKDHVVKDYGRKMLDAINGAQYIIQQCTHFLLSPAQPSSQPEPEYVYFNLDDTRKISGSLSEHLKITFGEGLSSRRVVLYNNLARHRQEVVRFRVAQHSVKVTDMHDRPVPSQVQPLFEQEASMLDGQYELLFLADVPPLSLSTFFISWVMPDDKASASPLASITLVNHIGESTLHRVEGFEEVQSLPQGEDFSISTERLSAAFSSMGLLKALTILQHGKSPSVIPIHLDFISYGARGGKERSGAYLFLPNGPAKIVLPASPPLVRILRGPLASQVEVQLPFVKHTVTVYNCSGEQGSSLEIYNLVELLDRSNTELAMRFSTSIRSGETFYSDLNGFQMVPRHRYAKLPLQAHFYPLSGMGYIEDTKTRLTVVSAQPLGAASLHEGHLEIMQDRRLSQDDNRGLNQGVMDNHPTPHLFRLMVEQKKASCEMTSSSPQPSLLAQMSLQSLLHPAVRQIWLGDPHVDLHTHYQASSTPLSPDLSSCGLHILNLRTRKANAHPKAGLVLHQLAWDTCFPPLHELHCQPQMSSLVNITSILPRVFGDKMKRATLSFLDLESEERPKETELTLCPMEISAYVLG